MWAEHGERRHAGVDVVHDGRVWHHDVVLFFQHFESGQQLQDGIIKTAIHQVGSTRWQHQDSSIRTAEQVGTIKKALQDSSVRTAASGWHCQD